MTNPEQALAELKRGNSRFAGEKSKFPNLDKKRISQTFREGQRPFAVVLTCSDSRTPPLQVFDQGIGDLFVVRVAGNVCDSDVLASIELGVVNCGAMLVVVMGHRNCGIITMAVKGEVISEAVGNLIDKIKPAIETVRSVNPEIGEEALIQEAAKINAHNVSDDIVNNSRIIFDAVQAGKLKVIAAFYDIESGVVEWLD